MAKEWILNSAMNKFQLDLKRILGKHLKAFANIPQSFTKM